MLIGNIKSLISYNFSIIPGQVVLSLKCTDSIARQLSVQPWDKRQLSNFVKTPFLLLPALGHKHTNVSEKWSSAFERCFHVIIIVLLYFLANKEKKVLAIN